MPTEQPGHGIRIEFNDFVLDPHDPDHMYRALNVDADRVTFEASEAVFWLHGTEECRFPISLISGLAPFPAPDLRAYAVEELRKQYPNAYTPWTADDDARLVARFQDGATIPDLMREFGRQRGGITARLGKHGLDPAANKAPLPVQRRNEDEEDDVPPF